MILIKNLQELLQFKKQNINNTVGFVPTMGALHEGHASLLQTARKENQKVVLSIFVNPTQFNQTSDFEKYPITLEADLKVAEKNQVDAVFLPTYDLIYPDNYQFKIIAPELTNILCGQHRPGHFDGVLTVVSKLFHLVEPTHSYFGEKDYQQYLLISKMTEAFFLKTKVIGLPTIREKSGLAMSSRNTRLSEHGIQKAALIFKTLSNTPTAAQAKEILKKNQFEVEYLEDHFNRRFVAAWLEGVRLIDNVPLTKEIL